MAEERRRFRENLEELIQQDCERRANNIYTQRERWHSAPRVTFEETTSIHERQNIAPVTLVEWSIISVDPSSEQEEGQESPNMTQNELSLHQHTEESSDEETRQ